jgi:hypothetical protein
MPVLLALSSLTAPEAWAITYGAPDCTDNATNFECRHPNTVSLSGFRPPLPGDPFDAVAFLRCSGTLLRKDDERLVFLTAGHCVSAWLSGLQDGPLTDVGVSFDALIVRDVIPPAPVWTSAQYILGGQPVLPRDFGNGVNASHIQFDYAVVVFEVPAGGLVTEGGQPVDLTGIDPVILPDEDFLADQVGAGRSIFLTAVGYGLGEAHNKPGEGGNAGGAVPDSSKSGVRWATDLTEAFNFAGPEANRLVASQNPAQGNEGTCFGDSGGPLFFDDNGTEVQVGITSTGDAVCRASSIVARTDGARAQDFLHCVLTADSTADILACGCTEVDKKGVCPDE